MLAASEVSLRRSVLLAALVPFLALTWRFDFLCDDGFITFRYARNFARGEGLVFNPGVQPPVEGYSEFLWAFALGLGQFLGASPLVLSRVISVLAGVLLIRLGVGLILERGSRRPISSHLAAVYLGSMPPLAVWATGGMATMPFAAAVTWLFCSTWGSDRPAGALRLGLIAGMVALLRADGAWWVAAVLGPAILMGLARGDRALWRPALLGSVIGATFFCCHMGWRWVTYGDWLPNTARVKVGLSAWAMDRGGRYLLHGLVTFPGVLIAVLLGLGSRGWGGSRLLPALCLVLMTWLYCVLSGGDFMAFSRFLVPGLPVTALLLVCGLDRLEQRGPVLPVAVGLLAITTNVLPAYGLAATPSTWRTSLSVRLNRLPDGSDARSRSELAQWRRMNEQAREWADLGSGLALAGGDGRSIVYGAVGAIGYYSNLFIYDRNGLVTRSVSEREPRADRRSPGHDKTVPPDFFRDMNPTYLDAFWYPGTEDALRRDPRIGFDDRFHRVIPLSAEESPRPHQLLVVLQAP